MTAKDAEERSKQTIDYLLQLREELVFILDSIVTGEYGKLTTQVTQTTEVIERVTGSSSENSLTVAEVINSAAFKGAINGVKESIPNEVAKQLPGEVEKKMKDITFNVNFDNGYLEYTIK
jgi:hypothetical protein